MKKYIIKLNGKVYEVEMEEVNGEVAAATLAPAPAAQTAAPAAPAPAPAAAPVSGGEAVNAPMPGTILNVAVSNGEQVKKGQVLVILEAMKMENEIVAALDGRILSVSVSKGQTVNAGDVLVQIG